jgi:hypothetical protein
MQTPDGTWVTKTNYRGQPCTLAQYKAALQGWRKFIDMPKSIDSELIIELPDGTP